MLKNVPTTSRNPFLLLIGSVLIWHIYHPLSLSSTFSIWSRHVSRSWWDKDTLWLRVMMWWWMVRMVCVSTRTHATYWLWNSIKSIFIICIISPLLVNSFQVKHFNWVFLFCWGKEKRHPSTLCTYIQHIRGFLYKPFIPNLKSTFFFTVYA